MTEHNTAADEALRRFSERTRDYLMAVANAKQPWQAADLVHGSIMRDAEVLVKDGASAYLRRLDSIKAFQHASERAIREIMADPEERR